MHRQNLRIRTLIAAAALVLAAALVPRAADAVGTPAGTSITNQATATYTDAAANSFSVLSNTTTVTVDPVYSVSLLPLPLDQSVASGTSAAYAYTLTNNGNVSNTYALAAAGVWGATVYADLNANGVIDGGEGIVASTGALAADAVYHFIVAVAVPANTPNGSTDTTTVTATGSGDPGAADDATDTVTTTAQAPSITLNKQVRNVTDGLGFGNAANAAPLEVLEYQISATNGGATAATNVVLSDPLSGNTGYVVGSASFNAGSSGLTGATIAYSNDSGATWAYVPASGNCAAPAGRDYCVTNIRWTTTGSFSAAGSFNVLFQVNVR